MWGRKRSERSSSAGLAARRRRNRRRALIAFGVLMALVAAGIIYLLWQPAFRIAHVDVFGTELPVDDIARGSLEGTYFGIAPRNSTFFIPTGSIRAHILEAYPTIAAVSIFRKGFTGITIKTTDRAPIARWCPVTNQISNGAGGFDPEISNTEDCYVFDASGVIFAPAASTTETIQSFVLYAPLEGPAGQPHGAKLANAALLPSTFEFARALATFGSRATSVVVSGDEVTVHLTSGTRLTYVLGHEQTAYAALVSAKGQLDLADGSIEYVDLRFGGKVYLKRKAAGEQEL